MVYQFVEGLREDTELAANRVAKSQRETQDIYTQREQQLLPDQEFAGKLKKIKYGQGWQDRGAHKMTLEDKFLVFGMVDKDNSLMDELQKKIIKIANDEYIQ